jgi:hypothetical protein
LSCNAAITPNRFTAVGLPLGRAHEPTGFAAADFSRVRQAKLQRFTVDRLMEMLGKLGQEVDVQVSVYPPGDPSGEDRGFVR